MSAEETDPDFSPEEERALSSVLNQIIPASGDGRLPGAGEIGLSNFIAEALRPTPELLRTIAGGLSTIDDLAGKRGSHRFADLSKADQLDVINDLAAADQAFLPTLIFHTCVGYYQNGRVLEGLGLEPSPPHPRGYDMDPLDLTLLEGVRLRPKMYKEC